MNPIESPPKFGIVCAIPEDAGTPAAAERYFAAAYEAGRRRAMEWNRRLTEAVFRPLVQSAIDAGVIPDVPFEIHQTEEPEKPIYGTPPFYAMLERFEAMRLEADTPVIVAAPTDSASS